VVVLAQVTVMLAVPVIHPEITVQVAVAVLVLLVLTAAQLLAVLVEPVWLQV
jgi:hypothetical protein